ncbi:MAG TPA: glycerol-3-phosphate 1-O-acyltransferase PlsY [Desulfobacterales bacterium]|jgi:glycerol-3-phosphate acyltransferase PlsY|nr:glycerol-3-phosphate 1-O-acyltransferase PlsY [Desulfobacterales bacterium]
MQTSELSCKIGIAVLAYLLGSIPCGLVLTRAFTATDVRRSGSGNIGATNVARVAGRWLGLATLAADVLKGLLPVYLVRSLPAPAADLETWATAAALLAFCGHLYPLYTRFRGGGKGVATGLGSFLLLAPGAVMGVLAVFLVVFFIGRRVSAASLAAAAALPAAVFLTGQAGVVCAGAVIVALFIFLRHAENIRRLRAGTEPEFRVPR